MQKNVATVIVKTAAATATSAEVSGDWENNKMVSVNDPGPAIIGIAIGKTEISLFEVAAANSISLVIKLKAVKNNSIPPEILKA